MTEQNKTKIEKDDEKQRNKTIFSQNIIFFRKKMNLSQKDMAERLNTTNKNISKWENAETVPDVFMIKKIATIFNVTVDTLISPITNENKIAIKTEVAKPFRLKLYMILLINALIILAGSVTFFILKSLEVEPFPLIFIFIYILPIIDISIFIFICIVIKKADPITLSLFGWLISICFYITFRNVQNIAYIFIVTVAYQILALIFTRLINTRKITKINQAIINRIKRKS